MKWIKFNKDITRTDGGLELNAELEKLGYTVIANESDIMGCVAFTNEGETISFNGMISKTTKAAQNRIENAK